MSAGAVLLRRALHSESMGGDDTSDANMGGFDPVVFWAVNAFIFLLLIAACGLYCWCFEGGTLRGTGQPGTAESDRIYHQTILQRQQRALERKRESPLVRKQKLEQAIQLHGLRMVVQEGDVSDEITARPADEAVTIQEMSVSTLKGNGTSSTGVSSNDSEEPIVTGVEHDSAEPVKDSDNTPQSAVPHEHDVREDTVSNVTPQEDGENAEPVDIEMGVPFSEGPAQLDESMDDVVVDDTLEECESGYLTLACQRQVPNCCAICLCPYEVAETVIWSNNKACEHAFHEECIFEWLMKQQEGSPCPCCRQEFVPNLTRSKEKQITWAPVSFNSSAISFR